MAKRKAFEQKTIITGSLGGIEKAEVSNEDVDLFTGSPDESIEQSLDGWDFGSEPSNDECDVKVDNDNNDSLNSSIKKRKETSNRLSAAEVRAAKDASESFRSSVFKLQVNEVLKEISIDEKYTYQARKLLFAVREAIGSTEAIKPTEFDQLQHILTSRIPFPKDSNQFLGENEIKYKFSYIPPDVESINVIGSWSLHTAVRRPHRTLGIDLFVPMADSLFEAKDILDFRYHRKRAFFLAALASQLADSGLTVEPRFELFNGHPLRPTLLLVPTGPYAKLGKRISIHIHVGPLSHNVFSSSRLHPHRNSNRAVEGPTPIYNWSILADMYATPLLKYIHAISAGCTAFVDAVKLGALWLEQRQWSSDPAKGGFGAFEFTVLMAALLNGGSFNGKKRLLHGFSSYQLFRGTLLYIAESDKIALQASLFNHSDSTRVVDEQGILFSDCGLDLLANLAPWAPRLLKHDCQLAVDMLNDSTRDRFESLFLKDCSSRFLRFDITFEVVVQCQSSNGETVRNLSELLHKAWGNRYLAMQIIPASKIGEDSLRCSWSLASDTPDFSCSKFIVGAVLDPTHCNKRITFVGPEVSNSPKNFRILWGSKATLRRFRDGSIKDAIIWSQTSLYVVQEAAEYILGRHLHACVNFPKSLEKLLPNSSVSGSGFTAIISSFQKLSQILEELRGVLPLRILSVHGTSSNLRYASLEEPKPFTPKHLAEAVIELESSPKWPKDLEASEKIKTAFLMKIAESIRKMHNQYYMVIGIEASIEDPSIEAPFAIIQSPEGFYFKLRISSQSLVNRHFYNLVNHTRLITTMVHRHSAGFSVTMRLTKLWLEKQMLMSYITEPAAELLALSVFVNSAPWAPPASGATGFWRVVNWLKMWDWRDSSLILDVDRHLETTEHHVDRNQLATGCNMDFDLFQSINTAFRKQRDNDPALTHAPWCISTKLDISGTLWTGWEPRSRIAVLIASRVTALANVASHDADIFKAAISDFDVVWTIKHLPSPISKHKNLAVSDPHNAIMSAHNVALDFVKAVTKLYKDSIVLFYSGSLGETSDSHAPMLCGIWNRAALDPMPKLKANIPFPVKQTKKGFELHKDAVLLEIERLGTGMLTRLV